MSILGTLFACSPSWVKIQDLIRLRTNVDVDIPFNIVTNVKMEPVVVLSVVVLAFAGMTGNLGKLLDMLWWCFTLVCITAITLIVMYSGQNFSATAATPSQQQPPVPLDSRWTPHIDMLIHGQDVLHLTGSRRVFKNPHMVQAMKDFCDSREWIGFNVSPDGNSCWFKDCSFTTARGRLERLQGWCTYLVRPASGQCRDLDTSPDWVPQPGFDLPGWDEERVSVHWSGLNRDRHAFHDEYMVQCLQKACEEMDRGGFASDGQTAWFKSKLFREQIDELRVRNNVYLTYMRPRR